VSDRPKPERHLHAVPDPNHAPASDNNPQLSDCDPANTEGIDWIGWAEEILENFEAVSDAVQAEIFGSVVLRILAGLGVGEDTIVEELIDRFGVLPEQAAAVILATFVSLGTRDVATAASGALLRLRASHVRLPAWAETLTARPAVRDCVAVRDPDGDLVLLAACFDRPGESHAALISMDPNADGVVKDAYLMSADQVSDALAEALHAANDTYTETELVPAEFRRLLEPAMALRDLGDRAAYGTLPPPDMDNEALDYPALSFLLHARLRAVPL